MFVFSLVASLLISTLGLSITEPENCGLYNLDELPGFRAIVENDNQIPDSVHYSINGESFVQVSRLNTDWPTFMQNNENHGYSESPGPVDNSILWTVSITGSWLEYSTPVVVDGLVYYKQNMDGDTLFALDSATGSIEWMELGISNSYSSVTVNDGKLFIATDSVLCIDALSGDQIWSFNPDEFMVLTPIVIDDNVFCVGGDPEIEDSTWVYCLDKFSGGVVWGQKYYRGIAGNFAYSEGKLILPTSGILSEHGILYAIDSETGSILWQNNDAPTYYFSAPVIVDDHVYAAGWEGTMRAFNLASGVTEWEKYIGGALAATPSFHSGTIYQSSLYSSTVALESSNGSIEWTCGLTSHGMCTADSMIFLTEYETVENPRVLALDAYSGDIVWSYQTATSENLHCSPSVVDGILYVAAEDGNLYAFGTGLKYTYLGDLTAQVGWNDLIATSYDSGEITASDSISFYVNAEGIEFESSYSLCLLANPNPFISSAVISFALPEPMFTSIEIFDLSGRSISSLVRNEIPAGEHTIQWNGTDKNGQMLSAGFYLCRIVAGDITETIGLCLLR